MQIQMVAWFTLNPESAITKQMVIDRGIDPKRMVISPVTTVQDFRTQAIKVADRYNQQDVDLKKLCSCV